MELSRESKTDLIILAADILRDARADREIRQATGAVGPGKQYPVRSEGEKKFLAELLDGTIVFFEWDPRTGTPRITPRWK